MLNKPAGVPISDVWPDAKGKSITLFAGAPVTLGIRGLLRPKAPPFFTAVSRRQAAQIRIYAGHTGWTAQHFAKVKSRAACGRPPPTPGTVFHPQPETLLRRQSNRAGYNRKGANK